MAVCLPKEAETVSLIRSATAHILETFGVTADCAEDILLALSEACTNVIDHASTDDEYEVQVRVEDEQCAISVKNTGTGFDAAGLSGAIPDPHSARGRGVAIMRAVMDTVDFDSDPEAGTIVHLVRALIMRNDAPMGRLGRRPRPT